MKHIADNSQPPKAPETVTRYRNADLCGAASRDLARVKAVFQQRAIVAHLKGGA